MSSEINPLMSGIKLPGRIFQLPSQGLFYTNGELEEGVQNGEIHVHPISAMDEIILKNPDQLFSGEAVATVFKRCMDGIADPSRLLSKDVDALMLFLRTVTYGPGYEFIAKHTCENAKDHSYIADVEQLIAQMKMLDPTTINELYTVVLPNKQIVKLKPYVYQDSIELIKMNQNRSTLTSEQMQQNLLLSLLSMISSVNGVSKKEFLVEWIKDLPANYLGRIGERIDKINDWGSDLVWEATCKDCGEKFKIQIPVNPVTFFTE